MSTICILGRQPKLSLAELEARFGATNVVALGTQAALLSVSSTEVKKYALGGTIKIAKVIRSSKHGLDEHLAALNAELPEQFADLPDGKVHLGLSAYNMKVSANQLHRAGLQLKKSLRATGRSVRVVPNKQPALGSAQVLHHSLTGPLGAEILFVGHGKHTYVAQTIHIQDIDDYSARDFGRPKRSGFVGMLPPKLAQIMLSLAGAQSREVILDPFCGTGVVLQEAALMGCKVHGTDVEPKMIDFSRTNLEWLQQKYNLTNIELSLEQGDARTMQWQQPIDHVVCETYLGQPLTSLPSSQKLSSIQAGCNELMADFLRNLHPQLQAGTRCCVAVPAWRTKNDFLHLPIVDQLEELGYNRTSFEHASDRDLIYHRSDQIVARELLVLTRK